MYWCITIWYVYVPTQDYGYKLITPWFMRDGVQIPDVGHTLLALVYPEVILTPVS